MQYKLVDGLTYIAYLITFLPFFGQTSMNWSVRQVATLSNKKNWITPFLYIAPIVIFSGVFLYYSIGFLIFTSFHEWNGIDPVMNFVGLQNFKDLFADRVFYTALGNNLLFFIFTVGIQACLGLFIAILLRTRPKLANFFKSVFFLPVVMAPVIIAAIFRIIMDYNVGNLNMVLRFLKLDFLAVSWLGDPRFALMSVIIVNIFEWMGFSMMIYYAGLLTIPNEVYEAAKIDGAGFWRTLFKITVPMLKGTTSTLIILGITGSLKTFDLVYMMTNSGPGYSSEVLTTFLYRRTMSEFSAGAGSAIGVMILILALVMSFLQIKFNDKNQNAME